MIRRATAVDLERLLTLEGDLFDNGMTERMLEYELEHGEIWVFGTPIIGYVITRKDGELLDIIRLGVVEGRRREGIGRHLLEWAILLSDDIILTVKKNNEPALRLYDSLGFKVVAHHATAEAFVMRRRVTLALM